MPENPVQLLSFINMKLRDFYPSLDMLCDDLMLDRKEIEAKLNAIGYEYNEAANKFW